MQLDHFSPSEERQTGTTGLRPFQWHPDRRGQAFVNPLTNRHQWYLPRSGTIAASVLRLLSAGRNALVTKSIPIQVERTNLCRGRRVVWNLRVGVWVSVGFRRTDLHFFARLIPHIRRENHAESAEQRVSRSNSTTCVAKSGSTNKGGGRGRKGMWRGSDANGTLVERRSKPESPSKCGYIIFVIRQQQNSVRHNIKATR